MSWMDSWSRPSKHAVTPPPLYLTAGDEVPYCHSCGRLIGSRKTQAHATEVKYCSTRCRNTKPGPLDRKVEAAFVALLNGQSPESIIAANAASTSISTNSKSDGEESDPIQKAASMTSPSKDKKSNSSKKKIKGDPRIVVECSDVEALVFKHEKDPEKVFGRKKNRAPRGVHEKPEDWKSVDMVDDPTPAAPKAPSVASVTDNEADFTVSEAGSVEDDNMAGAVSLNSEAVEDYGYGGGKVRPPQEINDVNGSVGGEKGWAERIEETEEMKAKRREGQRRAEEKEIVRRAARRLCAFGIAVPGEEEELEGKKRKGRGDKGDKGKGGEQRLKCEAVMKGAAVEASYAKGEWGIRWREKT